METKYFKSEIRRGPKGRIVWTKELEEELKVLYVTKGVDLKDLAKELGYKTPESVTAKALDLGVKRYGTVLFTLNEDIIKFIQVQLENGASRKEIASALGISNVTLNSHMTKHGIDSFYGYDRSTHKRCLECKKVLPHEDFLFKKRKYVSTPIAYCKVCHRQRAREKNLQKKLNLTDEK